MKLVLDELYSMQIAVELRSRGHDVVSVTERVDLAGLSDRDLFAAMPAERRAILTENWGDFIKLLNVASVDSSTHYGAIFTSRQKFPRGRNTIGVFVRALDAFLRQHPAEDALLNSSRWL